MTVIRSIVLAAAVSASAISAANADLINIGSEVGSSEHSLGQFTGTLNYVPGGANSATITISLTNTSPLANGGFLTALALWHTGNAGLNTVSFVSSSDANFGGLAGPVNGAPHGSYAAGASTGGGWTGGGSPSAGLAIGESATFTFNLSGTGVGLLSAATFINQNNDHWDLVIRFRGFENGGSDKVPANPTPGAAALLAIGGLAASRRRRP